MFKYIAYFGRVRLVSDDAEQLRETLRRDRDRRVRAERERRERAIRKEVREFRDRYRKVVFSYGNAIGLLCTFRPREQKVIARWWLDEQFTPPKPTTHVPRMRDALLEFLP